MSKHSRLIFGGVLSGFFLSGLSALIYEVLWVRVLTLTFGHTTLATSLVLAAFMLGLALGSYVGGVLANKIPPHSWLQAYAVIELAIAVVGWGSRPLLTFVPFFTTHFGSGIFSFIFLIIPTSLMGATFPLLVQWLSFLDEQHAEKRIGLLYGINTFGAVAGTALAGFYLIPNMGLNQSFFVAGLLNMAAALLVFGLSRQVDLEIPFHKKDSSSNGKHSRIVHELAWVMGLTGMAAMICEVAWTRAFALVLGSSTFAFSIMLLTFLLGISLGGLFLGVIRRVFPINRFVLGFLLLVLALSILAYLPVFNRLPYIFSRFFPFIIQNMFFQHSVEFLLCGAIMVVPTFFMGLSFPWIISYTKVHHENPGEVAGMMYSANTAGGIVGALAAGLFFLPRIGIENTLMLAVWIYVMAGIFMLVTVVDGLLKKVIYLLTPLIFFLALTAFRPKWDPHILSSGSFIYAPDYFRLKSFSEFNDNIHQNQLLFYKDGVSSSISVLQTPTGERFLRVNGKTDASTGVDMITQLLSGYVPSLFHQGPIHQAMVVGLGSGVSVGALSTFKTIESIDCVELEPAVVQAQPFFGKANKHVYDDPRFHVVLTDARHYLATTKKTYDVITSEPSNPWISGVANLYTKEAFELAKSRLNPDGVFSQWFHSYSMSEADFKMVMNTFASVFPHVMLLTAGDKDFFLMGSNSSWKIDYKKIEKEISDNSFMREDLISLGLGHPYVLLTATFLLDDTEFREFSKGTSLHRDNFPTLEFSAPRYLHHSQDKLIGQHIYAAKKEMIPSSVTNLNPTKKEQVLFYNLSAEAFLRVGKLGEAEGLISKAQGISSDNPRTWINLARIFNLKDQHMQAERAYLKAISLDPKISSPLFQLGMLYLDQNLEDKALHYLLKGLKLSPGDPMASLQVAQIYLKRKMPQLAESVLKTALSKPILNPEMKNRLGQLLDSISSK